MSIKDVFELISLCFSLLIPIIGFATALVRVVKDRNWNLLKSAICEFIIKAEETIDGSGQDKKNAVLSWAEEFCQKQNIKFDADQVSSAIETLIDLSKRVNVKKDESKNGAESIN